MSVLPFSLDSNPDAHELLLEEPLTEVSMPVRVILFNDEDHTFDEVIQQIVVAVGCGWSRAEELVQEVHHRGKAMVFEGAMVDCLRVSSVLEEIALHTQLEF